MKKLLRRALLCAPLFVSSALSAQPVITPATNPQLNPRISTAAQPVPIFDDKFYPDVQHYGTSSGQVANPRSAVQVYGFPRPNSTIELQVVGARPHVSATFYVSSTWADIDVPGLGRQLVGVDGATLFQSVTDGQGRATIAIPIPASTPIGEEYYVQCATTDTGPMPATELSKAAYFEVGEVVRPIGELSHLDGVITVVDDGVSTSSTALSGVYALEWRRLGTQVKGSVAIHTETTGMTVGGASIENLRVQPGANSWEVTWQSNNFLIVPDNTADEFLVSYEHAGTEYGPYVVAGTLASQMGDVDVSLHSLPSTDGGPLDGASIVLDMNRTCVEPDYFDQIEMTGLAEASTDGLGDITPGDVGARFARTAALMSSVLDSRHGDTGYYDPTMPGYTEFVEREAEILRVLTDGRASNIADIQRMIDLKVIEEDEGLGAILVSKLLSALGVEQGYKAFRDLFIEECGGLLKKLGKQVDAGEYKKAAKTIGKMLDKVMSKKFGKKLADKIGKKLAGKILAKVGSKFVPVVGWAWFALSLLWAFIEQWFD